MNRFENKVYTYIRENNMIAVGDRIVLGVSGGADSVGLLTVLINLQPLLKTDIQAVHVNHCLRGQQADEDQAWTQALCENYGIECTCFRKDIAGMARTEHLTEEEAGRNYRYDCFRQVRSRTNADLIAVAHHMDDAAETVLMNLLRGSGVRGLAGIRPGRGEVIRPLLCVTKREIEDYLTGKGISWRLDATNLETDHTRNKIRNELLPYIKDNINPQAPDHLVKLSWMMKDVSDYLDRQAGLAVQRHVAFSDGIKPEAGREAAISLAAFTGEDPVIQREMLRQVIMALTGRLKDVHMPHIEEIRELAGRQTGSMIYLPYGLMAVKTYDTVEIRPHDPGTEPGGTGAAWGGITVSVPGRFPLENTGKTLILSDFPVDKKGYFPKKTYTKWFDYDKIGVDLVVRSRQQGDYMLLAGNRRKMLRRIMLDDKIPAAVRDSMPLLAAGDQVLWLIGTDRISESVKVTEDTTHILCVELE